MPSGRLGFNVRRTMGVAQRLYEGVEIGAEGTVGLITYMRTDSTRVSPDAIAEAREFIGKLGPRYLRATPNEYAGKKQEQAQDAHEAIRPTNVSFTPGFDPKIPLRRAVPSLSPHLAALRLQPDDPGNLRPDNGRYSRASQNSPMTSASQEAC